MLGAILLPLLLCHGAPADLAKSAISEGWPTIEHVDLELRLHRPPRFEAVATLTVSGVRAREIPFLLNRDLSVTSASLEGGTALRWDEGGPLPSRYHREGRVVRVDLGRDPHPGGERLRIAIGFDGRGADGTGDQDWRGILLLSPDEFRMSEQSVFYPQVPSDLESPAVEPVRGVVRVRVPEDFEVFVPGVPRSAAATGSSEPRVWTFEVRTPSTLSLVAGRYRRLERRSGDTLLVALLKEEHADLGPGVLDEVERAHAFYAERFGAIDAAALGVCEIDCIQDSYNWAAPGLLVFDRAAFGSEGLPTETIGHEVAHLWWGGTVRPRGPGERFLTEGLAEYSSWRWLEAREGPESARRHAARERRRYLEAVHDAGADPAISAVRFGTKAYTALAYGKSALVLRGLEASVGRAPLDASLAEYRRRGAERGGDLGEFVEAVGSAGDGAREFLPWLLRDGHGHLALEEVREVEGRVRGVLAARPCPKGIPSVLPRRLPVRRLSVNGETDLEVSLEGGGRFEIDAPDTSVALIVDPEVTLPIADPPVHVFHPARLVRSDPADGAQDVSYLLGQLRLEFDRPLATPGHRALEELRAAVVERASASGAAWPFLRGVDLEEEGRALVLRLYEPLAPGREILLDLDGILLDARGLPVPDATLRFRTVASSDTDRPTVLRSDPPAGATDVDPHRTEIRIVFSEPMRPGRGYSSTEVSTNAKAGWRFPLEGRISSRWEKGGTVLVYELQSLLRPGARYLLPLRGMFRDLAGNALVDFELRFSTHP